MDKTPTEGNLAVSIIITISSEKIHIIQLYNVSH